MCALHNPYVLLNHTDLLSPLPLVSKNVLDLTSYGFMDNVAVMC